MIPSSRFFIYIILFISLNYVPSKSYSSRLIHLKSKFQTKNLKMMGAITINPSKFGLQSVGVPRVLCPGSTGQNWKAWIQGRPFDFDKELVDLTTGNIYILNSKDGVDWELEEDNPCLLPGKQTGDWWWFDSEHVGLGDVIIPGVAGQSAFRTQDGVFLCYFFGGSANKQGVSTKGDRLEIGVAVSQDGVHWSKVEGDGPYSSVVEAGKEGSFDSKYVGWPFVLEDGKQYKMYYQTYDAKENKVILCLAISKDGIKWKKEGKVFEGGGPGSFDEKGIGSRFISKISSNEYKMWYEGIAADDSSSIGIAVSSNGIQWKRTGDQPVFSPSTSPNEWDCGGVGAPHLVWMEDRQKWRLYYVGSSGKNVNKNTDNLTAIGIAESTDQKGDKFNRI